MRKAKAIGITAILALGSFYLVSTGTAKPLAPALKVAVLVSDSGAISFAGPIQRAAARLAVSDLSDSGSSVRVNLSFFDTGDTNEERARAVARVVSSDSDLVIAPIESESASILISQSAKLAMIAPMTLEDDLGSDSSKPWLFRLSASPSQESFALGEFISQSKPKNVLIVSGPAPVNKAQQKSLAFGLAMQGVRVSTMNIKDTKAIGRMKPDSLVLLSMEESIPFFISMADWVEQIPQVFLVPSNSGDYSIYPWARSLVGATSISPRTTVTPSFKTDLSKALGYSALSGARGSLVLNLGQRVYEAIRLAATAYAQPKSDTAEGLRASLASSMRDGKPLFDRNGFSKQIEYSVYRYGASGTFSLKSSFSPN
jgi:hypothetical protein